MEIIKEKVEREGCYNFSLKEGNKILKIIFGGNLDLYWYIYEFPETEKEYSMEELTKEIKHTFIITKENYFIYSLFENLMDDIKNARIYIPIKPNDYEEDEEDIWNIVSEDKMEEMNAYYKKRSMYQKLFDGQNITWHSDDDEYSVANRVTIKQLEDTFVLEFTSPEITEDKFFYRTPGSIAIRFRNSGSTYEPFNIIFMRMFHRLQEYNPEYHQIHIEELNHQKKLLKKKERV